MFWANSAADEQITADLITLGVWVFWGDSLHRLFFFFHSNSRRVVDVVNIEHRYNCCSNLCFFDIIFGWVTGGVIGLGEICLYCLLFGACHWRNTV